MTEINANAICVPEALRQFFEKHPKVALAFSGGVDSAYLLYAAGACGCDVRPYYVKTSFQPEFEMQDALRLCGQLGVEMTVVEIDILKIPQVAQNPTNRCYYCKRALFSELIDRAKADGYEIVIDGTNASDDTSDRPGMKALTELNVLSPLRACAMSKQAIREYSRRANLFTWNKFAYACLATRFPAKTEITEEFLRKVEGAEKVLFRMGFSDFRVRIYEGAARIQLPGDQMEHAIRMRSDIREAIEPYFPVVMMDLRDR